MEDADSSHPDPAGDPGVCGKDQQGDRCADHHTGHDPLILAPLQIGTGEGHKGGRGKSRPGG